MDHQIETGRRREERSGMGGWELVGLVVEGMEAPLLGGVWLRAQGPEFRARLSIRQLLGEIDHSDHVMEVAIKRRGESYPAFLDALEGGRLPEIAQVDLGRVEIAFDFRTEWAAQGPEPARRAMLRSRSGTILSGSIAPAPGPQSAFLVLTEARQHTILGDLALPDLSIRRSFLSAQAEGQGFTEHYRQLFRPPASYEGPIVGSCAQQYFRNRLWLGKAAQDAETGRVPYLSVPGSRPVAVLQEARAS